MRAIVTAIVLASLLLLGASAQQQPQPSEAAEELSIHGFGDRDRTCQEWTDGCRTCSRQDTGEPICPNIGISCQPSAIRCVRRAEQPK